MDDKRTFIFFPEWLNFIGTLSDKNDQLDLYNIIAEYGCTGEYHSINLTMIGAFESLIKPQIDRAQKNYQMKVDLGKTGGRPKKIDDNKIKMLAH